MLKSQINSFASNFTTIYDIATAALGEVDWNVSTSVTELFYEGEDDELECIHAAIETVISHNGNKISISTSGMREVFGSELGHYEQSDNSFELVHTSQNGREITKTDFLAFHPELSIDYGSLNLCALALFTKLPCVGEKSKVFKGLTTIQ